MRSELLNIAYAFHLNANLNMGIGKIMVDLSELTNQKSDIKWPHCDYTTTSCVILFIGLSSRLPIIRRDWDRDDLGYGKTRKIRRSSSVMEEKSP